MQFNRRGAPLRSQPRHWSCCWAPAAKTAPKRPPNAPRSRCKQSRPRKAGNLAPLDLVYVCGNKFLATNSTRTHRAPDLPSRRHLRDRRRHAPTRPARGSGPQRDRAGDEAKKGIVELYRDGQRVVRRRNLKLAVRRAWRWPNGWPSATAAEAGSWTAPVPVAGRWRFTPSLLPDGRVLVLGTRRVAPGVGSRHRRVHRGRQPGRAVLRGPLAPAGRPGAGRPAGTSPATAASPTSASSRRPRRAGPKSTPMRRGRWYPTNTTLANGSVVIIAGRDEVGDEVAEPEIWSPRRHPPAHRRQPGAALLSRGRSWRPTARVFYAGEQQTTRYLNTSGTGSWTTVGERRYGARSYGAAVMYEAGQDPLRRRRAARTNTAEIIDLNAASPTWQWTGSMAFARRNLNATAAAHRRGAGDRRQQRRRVQRRVPGGPGGGDVESGHRALDHDGEQRRPAGPTTPRPCSCPTAACCTPAAARAPTCRTSRTRSCTLRRTSPRGRGRPSPTRRTLVGYGTTFSVADAGRGRTSRRSA